MSDYRHHGITPAYLSGPPIGTDEQRRSAAAIAQGSADLLAAQFRERQPSTIRLSPRALKILPERAQ